MRRFLYVLATLGFLLAACGGAPDPASDPQGALKSAFDNLAASDSQTVTLSLDSDPGSLVAASEGDLSTEEANRFLDSSVVLSVKGDSPENAQFQFALNVPGTDGFEIRAIGQNVYVRADVQGLTEAFGVPQEKVDQAVQEGMAKGFDFLQAGVEGQWLSFEGAKQLAQQLAAAAGASPADSDTTKKVADAFYKALDESSTITSAGSDDIGDHLVASVDIKAFYGQIASSLAAFSPATPAGLPTAEDIPEGDAKVDIWIADDTVKQVEFDVKQLAGLAPDGSGEVPQGVDTLAIRLTFDSFDGDVAAPEGAVPVDLQAIVQQIMGGMTGSGMTEVVPPPVSGSVDVDVMCEQLKDAPRDVQDQFAEQCPDLGG